MNPIFDTVPEKKLAYLVMRKCACTSLLAAMEELRGNPLVAPTVGELHGEKPSFMRANEFVEPKEWFKFTFVRDPIRRFLSFYSNKVLNRSLSGNMSIGNPRRYGFWTNMSLDEAIEVAVEEKFEPETHVAPMSRQIEHAGFPLDFVGKIEEMKTGLESINETTGLGIPVFHLNQHDRVPLMLSEQQFARLSAFYEQDQERFGYERNYAKWCEANLADTTFQREEGFDFEKEAKLIAHKIEFNQEVFTVHLKWRVDPEISRERIIRVLNRIGNDQEILIRLPARSDFGAAKDSEGLVVESVDVPLSSIAGRFDPDQLCMDIYFWSESKKKAKLLNFTDATRLVLPLYRPVDSK